MPLQTEKHSQYQSQGQARGLPLVPKGLHWTCHAVESAKCGVQ